MYFSHRAVSCWPFSQPQLPAKELLPALCKIKDLSLRLPSAPVDADNNVHVRGSRDSLVRRHWKRGKSPSLNAQTWWGHNLGPHWGRVSLSHVLVTASFKCLNTLFTSLAWGRIRTTRSYELAVVTATAGSGAPEFLDAWTWTWIWTAFKLRYVSHLMCIEANLYLQTNNVSLRNNSRMIARKE